MAKAGEPLLEAYLQELFQFTIHSFNAGSQKAGVMSNANKLCLVWQRVILEAHI